MSLHCSALKSAQLLNSNRVPCKPKIDHINGIFKEGSKDKQEKQLHRRCLDTPRVCMARAGNPQLPSANHTMLVLLSASTSVADALERVTLKPPLPSMSFGS